MNMIFLVDGDNNIGTGLQGTELLTSDDSILIFYQKAGLSLAKIKELCKGSRASIQYLESVKGGKNSIDFQIITELGVLVGRGEADCAYVISQDKGYEAAMSALRARYGGAFREVALRASIAECLRASYLLRANTVAELEASLIREFGEAQGVMAFRRLQTLFRPDAPAAESTEEPAEPMEKSATKKFRGRRRSAVKPAVEKPAEGASAQTKPAGEKPAEGASAQTKPAIEKPAEGASAQTKPAIEKPAEGASAQTKPAGEKPAEGASAQTKPVIEKTTEGKPTEVRHVGARPTKPTDAKPEKSAATELSAAPTTASTSAEEAVTKVTRNHRGGRRKKKPAGEIPG